MKYQKGYTLVELLAVFTLAFGVVGVVGWVLNLITLLHATLTPLTTEVIVRIIGIIVFPVGMVMGFL